MLIASLRYRISVSAKVVYYPLDVGQLDIFLPLRNFLDSLADMADICHRLSALTVGTMMTPA